MSNCIVDEVDVEIEMFLLRPRYWLLVLILC